VRLTASLLDRLVAHARAEFPNECCGWIAARDGDAVTVHPVENVAASPFRFEMDSGELLRAYAAIEDDGLEPVIYHSHTRSEPYPSQTDVNFAASWPGVPWLILGVAGARPEVRCFAIEDGRIGEVEVEVEVSHGA